MRMKSITKRRWKIRISGRKTQHRHKKQHINRASHTNQNKSRKKIMTGGVHSIFNRANKTPTGPTKAKWDCKCRHSIEAGGTPPILNPQLLQQQQQLQQLQQQQQQQPRQLQQQLQQLQQPQQQPQQQQPRQLQLQLQQQQQQQLQLQQQQQQLQLQLQQQLQQQPQQQQQQPLQLQPHQLLQQERPASQVSHFNILGDTGLKLHNLTFRENGIKLQNHGQEKRGKLPKGFHDKDIITHINDVELHFDDKEPKEIYMERVNKLNIGSNDTITLTVYNPGGGTGGPKQGTRTVNISLRKTGGRKTTYRHKKHLTSRNSKSYNKKRKVMVGGTLPSGWDEDSDIDKIANIKYTRNIGLLREILNHESDKGNSELVVNINSRLKQLLSQPPQPINSHSLLPPPNSPPPPPLPPPNLFNNQLNERRVNKMPTMLITSAQEQETNERSATALKALHSASLNKPPPNNKLTTVICECTPNTPTNTQDV